jgi:hypothetical protein
VSDGLHAVSQHPVQWHGLDNHLQLSPHGASHQGGTIHVLPLRPRPYRLGGGLLVSRVGAGLCPRDPES